jgi:hypothetical protein
MTTATFTELLRNPNDVVARTEQGAVRITRRDAVDLVIMRAGELEGQSEGIALASRIMRAVHAHNGSMREALRETFAWTGLFSARALEAFIAEMDRLVWSSAELGSYGALRRALRSWEGTAQALAEGMAPDAALDWIDPSEWQDAVLPAGHETGAAV